MREGIYQWLTCFVVLFVLGLVIAMFNESKRITKLEQVCHGQCQYGDKECADRCDREGKCPIANR